MGGQDASLFEPDNAHDPEVSAPIPEREGRQHHKERKAEHAAQGVDVGGVGGGRVEIELAAKRCSCCRERVGAAVGRGFH
jgi:hypothetical protein